MSKHNTDAVRADSTRMTRGIDVGWGDGRVADADVYFEQFATHSEAEQLQRDYLEDHCHAGDPVFAVAEIPGAVGIRCQCSGDIVYDKITFVRGTVRVVANAWSVHPHDGHDAATRLALTASKGLEIGA